MAYRFRRSPAAYGRYMNEFGERGRYGSDEMREVFSPLRFHRNLRQVWTALARAQSKEGLVPARAVEAMEANIDRIDVPRIDSIETRTKHDIVASKDHFEEVARGAKGFVHLGATSMDVQDNAEVMVQKEALSLIKTRLVNVLEELRKKISEHKGTVVNAYTHVQAAEPTTLGYRYASYAQDLMESLNQVEALEKRLKGKGLKGAVGTGASYHGLLDSPEKARAMEAAVMKEIGLPAYKVTTQTYPRIQDRDLTSCLERISSTLERMGTDYTIVGSTPFNEYREGFAAGQKGSSAMPHKRNQTKVENVIGMGSVVRGFHHMVESSVKTGTLERTIHDSVVRRIAIPQIFLAAEEMLNRSAHILANTEVNLPVIDRNLAEYGIFGLSEPVLSAMSRKMDRSTAYDVIQEHAKAASRQVAQGGRNDFVDRLQGDSRITNVIPPARLKGMLSVEQLGHHVGDAPALASSTASRIGRKLRPYRQLIGQTAKIKI